MGQDSSLSSQTRRFAIAARVGLCIALAFVVTPTGVFAQSNLYLHPWLNDPIVVGKRVKSRASYRPSSDERRLPGLCGAIAHYRDIVDAGGWPVIDDGPTMKKGFDDPRVPDLRRRLVIEGDLNTSQDTGSTEFDITLHRAVRQFQQRNGLDADGAVGPGTLEAINVPATVRLATLLINLERVKAWDQDFGDRFFVVNIASSQLEVVENGELQYSSKVIIGREGRETPVLHSKITRIDFNPYWNAPASIARKDLLADIQNDPGYFERQHIRVFSGAIEISPDEIDWSQYSEDSNLPYRFRQDPGPWNVLGPVKFVFANNHAVYLHGTSNESLFDRKVRAFSSGCVRVEQAVDIAGWLATKEPGWSVEKIQELIDNYKQRSVTLSNPVPIHLIYRTAWVDEAGLVNFRPDIYDWDPILDVKWGHLQKVPCLSDNPNRPVLPAYNQKRAQTAPSAPTSQIRANQNADSDYNEQTFDAE